MIKDELFEFKNLDHLYNINLEFEFGTRTLKWNLQKSYRKRQKNFPKSDSIKDSFRI